VASYCAVVKYALDDDQASKRRALTEGLGMIAMELVAEHGFTAADIEEALEAAQGEAELELEMKGHRAGR
jgi:hypothetical protein